MQIVYSLNVVNIVVIPKVFDDCYLNCNAFHRNC